MAVEERYIRLSRNFLVHSYLYYQLDRNVIEDYKYDALCRELYALIQKHTDEVKDLPYYDLLYELGDDASGAYLAEDKYPPPIVTTAMRVLWMSKRNNPRGEDFPTFISRWNFKIIPRDEWK